jgi:soluble lytic murein transglycosylase-like protein
VSLLNGLGAFGASLSAFASHAAADAEATPTRAPLLNSTPAAPASVESTPPAAAAAAAPAPAASGRAGSVPAEYLPLYEAASKRTGIPVDVLIAQARQESGFDPNVVSGTGGIGLHQIQAATARDPGYGLAAVDPATLKDPRVNIAFAADYMRARAGPGADFNDPRTVNAALAAYNGGGDPRYVQNVRRYIGAVA